MAEVRERCTTLTTEVATLRKAIEKLGAVSSTGLYMESKANCTYAGAARAAPRRSNPLRNHSKPRSSAKLSSKPSAEVASRPQRDRTSAAGRVPVVGARRVWGAYALCTPAAIQGAITKLTSVKTNLQVRRKTRVLPNNKSVWWFVIHGQESLLSTLDAEWDKVHLQTKWSLERCYMTGSNATEATELHSQVQASSDATITVGSTATCTNSSSAPSCSVAPSDSPTPLHDADGGLGYPAANGLNSPCVSLNRNQNEVSDDPNPMAAASAPTPPILNRDHIF